MVPFVYVWRPKSWLYCIIWAHNFWIAGIIIYKNGLIITCLVCESIVCTAPEQNTSNSVSGDLVHCYKDLNIWKHTLLPSSKIITLFACIFSLLRSMPNSSHAHRFLGQKQWSSGCGLLSEISFTFLFFKIHKAWS